MDERESLADASARSVGSYTMSAILRFAVAFAVALLVGCTSAPKGAMVKTKTEAEVALAEVREEWLKKCEPVIVERGNSIGDLLKDYADASAALAECMARHNDFVEYIGPLVRKERKR